MFVDLEIFAIIDLTGILPTFHSARNCVARVTFGRGTCRYIAAPTICDEQLELDTAAGTDASGVLLSGGATAAAAGRHLIPIGQLRTSNTCPGQTTRVQ